MKNALLIYDRLPEIDRIEALLKRVNLEDLESLIILPLDDVGLQESVAERIKSLFPSDVLVQFAKDLTIIHQNSVDQFGERIEALPKRLRETEVGSRSIQQHLEFANGKTSAWWFSKIQERNPLICSNWGNWIKLQTCETLLSQTSFDLVFLDIENSLIHRAIRNLLSVQQKKNNTKSIYSSKINLLRRLLPVSAQRKTGENRSLFLDLASGFKALFALIKRLFVTRKYRCEKSRKKHANSRRVFVGYYPSADQNAKKKGIYRSNYLKELQEILFEDPDDLMAVFVVVPNSKMSFEGCLSEMDEFSRKGNSMCALEHFIHVSDLFRIVVSYFHLVIRSSLIWGKCSKSFLNEKIIKSWEIPLLKSLWNESFRSGSVIESMIGLFAFENFYKTINQDCEIVYSCEFQSWEYCLNATAHQFPGITTIAAIQGNPADNYFQYKFSKEETNQFGVFPDLCVSYSRCFDSIRNIQGLNYLSSTAYRLMNLLSFMEGGRRRTQVDRLRVGIIGSGTYEESFDLLRWSDQAFGMIEKDAIYLSYRTHPVMGFEKINNHVLEYCKHIKLLEDSNDMHGFLENLDLVIATNTTAIIEALAAGCEIVSPRFYGGISVCPLEHTEARYWRVTSVDEMADAFSHIKKGERINDREKTIKFLRDYINLDPDYIVWKSLISA